MEEEDEEIDELADDLDLQIQQTVRAPLKRPTNRKSTSTTSSTSTSKAVTGRDRAESKKTAVKASRTGEISRDNLEVQSKVPGPRSEEVSPKRRKSNAKKTVWTCPPVDEDGEPIDETLPHKSTRNDELSSPSGSAHSSLPSSIELPLAIQVKIKASSHFDKHSAPSSSAPSLDISSKSSPLRVNKTPQPSPIATDKSNQQAGVSNSRKSSESSTRPASDASQNLPLSRLAVTRTPAVSASPLRSPHTFPRPSNCSNKSPIPSPKARHSSPSHSTSSHHLNKSFKMSPSSLSSRLALLPITPLLSPKPVTHQLIPLTPSGISDAVSSLLNNQKKVTEQLEDQLAETERKLTRKEKLNFQLTEKFKELEKQVETLERTLVEKNLEIAQLEKGVDVLSEIRRGLLADFAERDREKAEWVVDRDRLDEQLFALNGLGVVIAETDDEQEQQQQ